MNKKLAIIVPSIRPEAFCQWWNRWYAQLNILSYSVNLKLYVVWDMENCPSEAGKILSCYGCGDWVQNLSWKDIRPEWKDVVHTKSDSVRNLGFLKAYEDGFEYFCTLDDDTLPIDNLWVDRMLLNLQRFVDPVTYPTATFKTRGMPSKPLLRPVMLHQCLWEGIPDVYARDQIGYNPIDGTCQGVETVPFGSLTTVCGMALGFHRNLMPAMYFWNQDKIRRYGDIWMGLTAKKVIDACGWAMTCGSPSVFHTRMSNIESNQEYEDAGLEINDFLWKFFSEFSTFQWKDEPRLVIKQMLKYMPKRIFNETGCQLSKWINLF